MAVVGLGILVCTCVLWSCVTVEGWLVFVCRRDEVTEGFSESVHFMSICEEGLMYFVLLSRVPMLWDLDLSLSFSFLWYLVYFW